jgi:hypothetical protein
MKFYRENQGEGSEKKKFYADCSQKHGYAQSK